MNKHLIFPPVPNYSELRRGKDGYDTRYTIDTSHPLYSDPLVDLREKDFGLVGAQSYYATKIPGLPDAPLARLDIAKRLKWASDMLKNSDVREYLGVPVGLFVPDAIRPHEVQVFAYNEYWPSVIQRENPLITPEELTLKLKDYIAKPKDNPTPTPHLTGGAVDVALVNIDTGKHLDRGHKAGSVSGTAFPDFHEGYHLLENQSDIQNIEGQSEVADENSEPFKYRRVLHFVMSEAGLSVNPTEIWHYGKGDPLSAYVAGNHQPYYGVATLPDWFLEQMRQIKT